MKFEIGSIYSGFRLDKITFVREISASTYEFEHIKSGAKLLYIDRDDDNKVFSAAFKTLPEDSTGVFHILEHSVLCGSKKYPVKEPFVDMLKGSMQTFLNALTFPDKTMYPCASCNDKDFANLMSVYLDAVFAPAIYDHEEIFKQEGWHIELLDKNDEPEYKGVVYNEMKGSFSSVDTQLYSLTDSSLFPDTFYRFSSGGFPPEIINLTYEQFINTHRKYYHPENSFLYLYGNMDLEERLAFIDREYLSKFERTGNKIEVKFQKPVINKDVKGYFAIADNEEEKDNYYTALSYVVGDYSEREKLLALEIIFYALTSNNSSPLKKLFIDKNMAQDMWAFTYDGIAQPYAIFQLRKTNPESAEIFEETLISALKDICEKGIDKKLLKAAINQIEFALREGKQGGTPAGLSYDFDLMDGWLYGASPDLYLRYEDALVAVKQGLDESSRYFENIIETVILNSNHMSKVLLIPSKTKQKEDEEKEKEALAKYKASLNEHQLEKLIEDTKALIKYQSTENTPEELASIPTLDLSDIGENNFDMPNEISEKDEIKYLYHDINTNKIAYERWYFDISCLDEDELQYASLLSSILGDHGTKNYSDEDIVSEQKIRLGGLGFSVGVYSSVKNADKCTPTFIIYCSVLENNIKDSVELINEIITTTKVDKAKLKTGLAQMSSNMRNHIIRSGSQVAKDRVSAYFTKNGAYENIIHGMRYYEFVKSLVDKIDDEFDEINSRLMSVASKIFVKGKMTIGYTGSRDSFERFVELCSSGVELKHAIREKAKEPSPEYKGNEAICVPSGVNYCVKGVNYLKNGYKYNGKMRVLAKILGSDYLWNEIRVKGGAYGTGFSVSASGCACFHSYRDPNVAKTLENFDKAADYLAQFTKTNPSIIKYIISTVAAIDHPITPRDIGGHIENSYFTDSDAEYKKKIRTEVIETTSKDIENFADLVRLIAKENYVCTVGSRSKIEEAGDVFDLVEDL